jgi:LysM repeat protein
MVPPDQGNTARRVHRVESGDTLYGVARRHGLDVKELAALNGLTLSDGLKPGQELLLTP